VIVLALIVPLSACTPREAPTPIALRTPNVPTPAPAPTAPERTLTAAEVVASLQASGLPVEDVEVLTPETDPDRLLGRPNQYVVKVTWNDARGGPISSLEILPTLANFQARRTLLRSTNIRNGIATYHVLDRSDRRALLRVPASLSAEEARQYEQWLASL
jgi:hypothetical protein